MLGRSVECGSVRNILLDRTLTERCAAEPPQPAVEHLRSCTRCQRYSRVLRAVSLLPGRESLYTPSLRHRTLAAINAAREERIAGLLPLLVPAAVASLAASLLVPIWLVTHLLQSLFGYWGLSLIVAVVFSSSIGLAAVGPVLIALVTVRSGGSRATLQNG